MVSPSSKASKRELNRIGDHYRLRFEQTSDYGLLLEYALRPSAWQMPWFKQKVREHLILFIHWCRNRRVSYEKIAAWLNAKGPKPLRGKAWHRSTIRYLTSRTSALHVTPKIRPILGLLKALGGAWENRQPGLDQSTLVGSIPEARVRRVRKFYEFLLPMAREYVAYLDECFQRYEREADRFQRKGTRMLRRGDFAFRFYGTPSFKPKGLVEVSPEVYSKLKQDIAAQLFGEKDIYPTRREVELLGRHKVRRAVLQIACRLEGLSLKTFRRYRAQTVQ